MNRGVEAYDLGQLGISVAYGVHQFQLCGQVLRSERDESFEREHQ